MRPEIRKINSTDFAKNFGAEIKFVTEWNGHLWLTFRGKPRAVVIPMRDEALLNELHGRDFEDVLHKANVRHARQVRAAYRAKMFRSEQVMDDDFDIPPQRMTDAEYEAYCRQMFHRNGPVTDK